MTTSTIGQRHPISNFAWSIADGEASKAGTCVPSLQRYRTRVTTGLEVESVRTSSVMDHHALLYCICVKTPKKTKASALSPSETRVPRTEDFHGILRNFGVVEVMLEIRLKILRA